MSDCYTRRFFKHITKLMNNAQDECHNIKRLVKLGSCCPTQSNWCATSSKGTPKKLKCEISKLWIIFIEASKTQL